MISVAASATSCDPRRIDFVLQASDGIHSTSITLAGSYSTSGFLLGNDGQGSELITYNTPVDRPPTIDVAHSSVIGSLNELPNVTGSLALDFASGAIAFTDADLGDRPTASVVHQTVVYHDTHGNDDTAHLTSAQITAFENAY
jgi:fibronectin-binding autotransporter adhesin